MRTEEELRDDGWSEAEIRDYMRGWNSAQEQVSRTLPPATRRQPRRAPAPGTAFSVAGPDRDYEAWRENTPGGRFHALLYPDRREAYTEHQETVGAARVRAVADEHELTYDRRPDLAAVRAIEHARGWRRRVIGGGITTRDIQDMVRAQFPHWPVRDTGEELPPVPYTPLLGTPPALEPVPARRG